MQKTIGLIGLFVKGEEMDGFIDDRNDDVFKIDKRPFNELLLTIMYCTHETLKFPLDSD